MRTTRALHIGPSLKRDQSHANWEELAFELMEEEWAMEALCLCGEDGQDEIVKTPAFKK